MTEDAVEPSLKIPKVNVKKDFRSYSKLLSDADYDVYDKNH